MLKFKVGEVRPKEKGLYLRGRGGREGGAQETHAGHGGLKKVALLPLVSPSSSPDSAL